MTQSRDAVKGFGVTHVDCKTSTEAAIHVQVYANSLLNQVRYVSGIADARIQQPFDQPYMHLSVDRTKAQEVGFNTQAIAQNVLADFAGR